MTALGDRGGAGSHLQGIQLLWAPPGDGDLLLILGRFISAAEDDWSAVFSNLLRARAL